MRHKQKIAIARILSDLIKSDELISREEIAAYNKIVRIFEISSEELFEAQQITLADALKVLRIMSQEEQKKILSTLSSTNNIDKIRIANEALILLTISYIFDDKEGRCTVVSRENKGQQSFDKYIMYIESDYMHSINQEILMQYDAICNLLQLWNIQFIYIPKLASDFREMDYTYLCDILKYLNPRLSQQMIENLYSNLISITTEAYTRDYLSNVCQQNLFYDIPPSLLVSIGTTSISTPSSQRELSYVNHLIIQLKDKPNAVFEEIQHLVEQYKSFITIPEWFLPNKFRNNQFRYYGFYKQLFDYLSSHHIGTQDNNIVIDVTLQRLYIRGTAVPMSATLLATYMLILHQTFCTYNEGLIKAGTHHPLSEKDVHHLTKLYNTILKLFREMPTEGERNYINEVNNIRTYIARIRSTISNYIDAEHINEYLPKDSYQKDRYQITIDPSRIYIREGVKTYLLKDYPLWEKV